MACVFSSENEKENDSPLTPSTVLDTALDAVDDDADETIYDDEDTTSDKGNTEDDTDRK